MTNDSTLTAGIDTSKARLDVAVPGLGRYWSFANAIEGWAALAERLAEIGVERVGIEASGGYERGVIDTLRAAGFDVRLLQPMQVRFFARMRLRRAKNDRLDAEIIARCAELIEQASFEPDGDLRRLADHLTYVEQIEEDIARLKIRREHHHDPRLLALDEEDIARLKARRRQEIARLVAALRDRHDHARRLDLLISIPGIGERTALTLVIRMPELGHLDREQIAMLAGLAPLDDDSGTRSGARHVAGGRARVRKALFCAAIPAAYRWNPALVDLRTRLAARGKPFQLTIVACARKLLTYANAVLRHGSPWVEAGVG